MRSTGAISVYHVPSFFDIVTFNHDFGAHWKLDTRTYTYGYSNHQHYQNNTDNDLTTDPGWESPRQSKKQLAALTSQVGNRGTTPTGDR